MPFQKNGKRDYKREKAWDHSHDVGKRLRDRVKRVQARRDVEKTMGKLPTSMQVDHKRPLIDGGSNKRKNLRVVSAYTNLHKEGLRKKRSK